MQSLSDQIVLAEGNLASASETLRLTRERKQFGVGVVLEDIQAEQELERARSQYVNALAQFNKAQYGLSRAVGSLSSSQADSLSHRCGKNTRALSGSMISMSSNNAPNRGQNPAYRN